MVEDASFDAARIPSAIGDRNGPMAWVEYLAARAGLESATRLPRGVQMASASALARVARRVDRRHSDSARRYLRAVFGEQITAAELEDRVLQAWEHFFRITLESVAFERRVPQAAILDHYEVEWCDGAREALSAGRGGVFLTPHVGDWEAASAALPHLGAGEIYAVARPPKNRPLSRYLLAMRERRHIHVLPRRGAMKFAHEILAAGGWIGLLPDQRPSGRGVLAPFFGKLAPCERSASALVRRMAVPIVIGACYLTDEPFRYRGRVSQVIWPEELAELTVEEITARINAAVEPLILAAPEQYFWLHDRFRDAPPDAAEDG